MKTGCSTGVAGARNSESTTEPSIGARMTGCTMMAWVQQQMQSLHLSSAGELGLSLDELELWQRSGPTISQANNSTPVSSNKNIAVARKRSLRRALTLQR